MRDVNPIEVTKTDRRRGVLDSICVEMYGLRQTEAQTSDEGRTFNSGNFIQYGNFIALKSKPENLNSRTRTSSHLRSFLHCLIMRSLFSTSSFFSPMVNTPNRRTLSYHQTLSVFSSSRQIGKTSRNRVGPEDYTLVM